MDYRGMILRMSPTGEDGRCNDYVCTAHYAGHVEIVPTVPGTETKLFSPIPLQGPGPNGVVYDSWRDGNLIQRVKERLTTRLRSLEQQDALLNGMFGRSDQADLNAVKENLVRLDSLDDGRAVGMLPPLPGDVFPATKECPCYAGKLVFLEVPLRHDDNDSGEYIVVQQSDDSLYVVDTTCCTTGVRVQRFPFSAGDEHITILDSYEDDDFIREFVDRLDDMDTETYRVNQCDAAETVSRQLTRMLERNTHCVHATDVVFNSLGCHTGRVCCE